MSHYCLKNHLKWNFFWSVSAISQALRQKYLTVQPKLYQSFQPRLSNFCWPRRPGVRRMARSSIIRYPFPSETGKTWSEFSIRRRRRSLCRASGGSWFVTVTQKAATPTRCRRMRRRKLSTRGIPVYLNFFLSLLTIERRNGESLELRSRFLYLQAWVRLGKHKLS